MLGLLVRGALFFVYAAQFLRPSSEVTVLSSPPLNRTESLLIYRIQSHIHPKRRKFYLKHAGQKSVKEELLEQRKGPKRAVECRLKVQTHVWDQDAAGSNPVTSTIPFRNQTPCSYLSTGFSAVSLSAIRKTKNKKPARWVALYRAGFLYGFLAYCIYI